MLYLDPPPEDQSDWPPLIDNYSYKQGTSCIPRALYGQPLSSLVVFIRRHEEQRNALTRTRDASRPCQSKYRDAVTMQLFNKETAISTVQNSRNGHVEKPRRDAAAATCGGQRRSSLPTPPSPPASSKTHHSTDLPHFNCSNIPRIRFALFVWYGP